MAARNRKTTRRSGAASEGRRQRAPSGRRPCYPNLSSLFAELSGIGVDRLDPHASFFELGFDSLFLTRAVLAVQNRFGVRVSFRQLLGDLSSLETLGRSGPIPPDRRNQAGGQGQAAVG